MKTKFYTTRKAMFKRYSSIIIFTSFLSLTFYNSLATSVWDGSSANIWTNGSGTSANPFLIETAANLVYLANQVNDGNNFSGKYFKMTDSIDINNNFWTPIGESSTYYFAGYFDGNGFNISNLFIYSTNLKYAGLFGNIRNSSIKNICITSGSIKCTSSSSCYIGGIVGYANNSSLSNCSYNGDVNCTVHSSYFPDCFAGGIVGYAANSTILTNCNNSGTIYGNAYSNSTANSGATSSISIVGGIIGKTETAVELYNCINSGEITGVTSAYGSACWSESYSGGIIGEANSSKLNNCQNIGNVFCKVADMPCRGGGLIGVANNIELKNCSNSGHVSGLYTNTLGVSGGFYKCIVGGLIGTINGDDKSSITNCFNQGEVTANCSKVGLTIGGLVGNSSPKLYLINCYNSGKVSCYTTNHPYDTPLSKCAGILGDSHSSIITNCFNMGAIQCITPDNIVGGIIGSGGADVISSCYNIGSIITSGTIFGTGGIVGYSDSSFKLSNCYYLSGCISNSTNTKGKIMTSVEMQSPVFVVALNNGSIAWKQDNNNINNGYPILTYITGNIKTSGASDITQTSAMLNGIVDIDATIITKGFQYKLSTDKDYSTIVVTDSIFNYQLTGLTPNTSYTYRVFVGTVDLAVIYADSLSFKTLPIFASTQNATDVTRNTATLEGELFSGEVDVAVLSKGFKIKKAYENDYHFIQIAETELKYNIDGLTPGTEYNYFTFIETENYGSLCGDTINFTTTLLTTLPATNITATTALFTGEYDKKDISGTILNKGFEYKKATESQYTTVIITGENFSNEITKLISGIDYSYLAFIYTLEQGIIYGNESYFTTFQPYISISSSSLSIASKDASVTTIDLATNTTWNTSSDQPWLTVSPATGTGNATLTFTAEANTETTERTATVTVSAEGVENQTITVTQEAGGTGIPVLSNEQLILYPNPTTDQFSIKGLCETAVLTISTLNGQVLLKQTVSNKENISISSLPQGIYIVKLETTERILLGKIIRN